MNVHCQDCDHTFLLTPDGATQSAACPSCGGTRLERDQPSPTHSDGDLRNMVDPGLGLDQGGNPNQEGIWATTDGGWQNYRKRDESFASVKMADFDFGDGGFDFGNSEPTHKFIVDQAGKVYSHPNPISHEDIAEAHQLHGFPHGLSLGELHDDGSTTWFQHQVPHSPEAIAQMLYGHFGHPVTIDPNLKPTTNEERWGIGPGTADPSIGTRELDVLYGPPRTRQRPALDHNEGLIRGGGLQGAISMDPYMPWTHEAEAQPIEPEPEPIAPAQPSAGAGVSAQVTPGAFGIHNGTIHWLSFLNASVDGLNTRQDGSQIFQEYGMRNSPKFGQPVTVSVAHQEYLAPAVDLIQTSASSPTPSLKEVALGISQGRIPPPEGIDPAKLHFGSIKIAGPAAGLVAGLGSIALPRLMQGALMGVGSHAVQGLLGQPGEASPGASQPPRDPALLASTHEADAQTPTSNPGYVHDEPEAIDQHEFNDGDSDPNQYNPNLQDSGASGEDAVREHAGFAPDSPGVERASILAPLLLHYYHSDESGAQDKMVRELHDQLEQENPGYLDRVGPEHEEALAHLLQHLKQPDAIHAKTAGPQIGVPNMTGPLNTPQNVPQNGVPVQAVPGPQQQSVHTGACPYCGGPQAADGTCTQCGAKVDALGGAQPTANPNTPTPFVGKIADYPIDQQPNRIQNELPSDCPHCGENAVFGNRCHHCGAVVPPQRVQPTPQQHNYPPAPMIIPVITGKIAADHQGPVTDEQKSAVAELLISEGRQDEIPGMLQQPWNYAREMAQIGQRLNVTPNVDPNEQPPAPPVQEMAPPGATMPMPNPAAPTQQMAAAVKRVEAADNAAPRCPKCGSATTGLRPSASQKEISAECHACGNIWEIKDADISKLAAPNTEAIPAAEHHEREDEAGATDSSHTWQTQDGQPLQEGAEYEMHSPGYQIPDIVRIDQIKPDAIVVSTIGEYSNDDSGQAPLEYQHEITKEEADLENLNFVPSDGDSNAGEQSLDEYSDSAQAPVFTQPQGPDTHNFGLHASVEEPEPELRDDICPSCASTHIASELSSPTTEFHECYKCGHGWETKEEDYSRESGVDLSWLNEDTNDDFFAGMERARAMREAGIGSRSIADVASRDNRLQEIKQRLDAHAQERTAGKKFTPREQREFIDEDGIARNSDKLDLAGTHYEAHKIRYDLDPKANGMNVPDSHLFIGI